MYCLTPPNSESTPGCFRASFDCLLDSIDAVVFGPSKLDSNLTSMLPGRIRCTGRGGAEGCGGSEGGPLGPQSSMSFGRPVGGNGSLNGCSEAEDLHGAISASLLLMLLMFRMLVTGSWQAGKPKVDAPSDGAGSSLADASAKRGCVNNKGAARDGGCNGRVNRTGGMPKLDANACSPPRIASSMRAYGGAYDPSNAPGSAISRARFDPANGMTVRRGDAGGVASIAWLA